MTDNHDLFVSAIIVGAGQGKRMGGSTNKLYVEVGKEPIIAKTIRAFELNRLINEIIVVAKEDDIPWFMRVVIDKYDYRKVKCVVAGGAERQDSVYNGIKNISEKTNIITVHDGARAFVDNEVIELNIMAAYKHGAAITGVRVKDTIKAITENNIVEQTLDRSKLWSIQTPQSFRRDILVDAYERAMEENTYFTDDSGVIEKFGKIDVVVTKGSYYNIKVTTIDDLLFANFFDRFLGE